ncbi:MAG: lamin tail domain-containing protein [Deltaproteobacteria bacterium]|nr:lamin tail domain-containing protein [Deltaproteobacteria bacterium]
MRTKLWSTAIAVAALAAGCGDDSSGDNLGIAMFNVAPGAVPAGGDVLLTWRVTAAQRVRIEACSGFDSSAAGDPLDRFAWCIGGAVAELPTEDPSAAQGSLLTTVLRPTRFGLTALAADGTAVQSEWKEVAVDAPPAAGPQVLDFRASPRVIFPDDSAVSIHTHVRNVAGDQVLLCDASSDADDPGRWEEKKRYEPDAAGVVLQSWDMTATEIPTQSRLYGLKTAGGIVLAYAQLVVRTGTEAVPNIVEFSIDPLVLDEGDAATLTWEVIDATPPITVSPPITGFSGATSAGSLVFAPPFFGSGEVLSAETIYTMTATNGIYSDVARVILTVNARPVVDSFTALPTTVAAGADVTLTWETSRTSSVVITAVPPDAGLPATFELDNTTGIIVHPAASTTYTLTASGATTAPTTATTTVTVGSGPSVDSFTANPAAVAVGGTPVTLTWTTSNADSVTVTAVPPDATLLGPFALDGTATAHPAAGGTTTYTITATGPVGAPASIDDSVTAVAPGDVVITEIMFDPAVVADNMAEWFEIRNVTTRAIPLAGFVLGDGTYTHTVTGTPTLAAGDWFVFGINTNTTTNGGAAVDYQYATLAWPNTGTLIPYVGFDGVALDTTSLAIGGAWTAGDAIVLNPAFTTAAGNDTQANWCAARAADAYGTDGNHGTPGALNACP